MAKALNFWTRPLVYILLFALIFCIDTYTFYPFMYIKEWILKFGLLLLIGLELLIDIINKKRIKLYFSYLNISLFIMFILFLVHAILSFGSLKLAASSLINIFLLCITSIILHKKILKVIKNPMFFIAIECFALIIDFIAVLQIFGLFYLGGKGRTAIMTTLGSVNFTAFFLGIAIIISIGNILYRKYSLLSIINILFSFPILFYCRSRAAFFYLIFILFIMLLSISDTKKRNYSLLVFCIILISIFLVLSKHNSF